MTSNPLSNYEILIDKLQEFIRKFYLQQWIKGSLQFILCFLVFYLISTTLEYNLYFSIALRRVLFYSVIVLFILLFIYWIAFPIYYYFHQGKRLNTMQAADIIGKHFPTVQDKLINVLHLQDMSSDVNSHTLIQASIDQKSKSLVLVQFNEAIDMLRVLKLGKYLMISLAIMSVLYFIIPNLFLDSTHRLLNYNQVFSPKAPFEFQLMTSNLKAQQFESIVIKAKLSGKSLPENLNLYYKNVLYPMEKLGDNQYQYTLQNLESNEKFRLESMGFYSDEYQIDIMPKPIILDYEIRINPPNYTHLESSIQKNSGDIIAPEGSTIIWKFKTDHIDYLAIKIGKNIFPAEKYINGFGLKANLKNVSDYTLLFKNNQSQGIDSLHYSVSLIADAHPMISIQEFNDSLNEIDYYTGSLSDDYGLSSLHLVVQYSGKNTRYSIPISKSKHYDFQFSTRDVFQKYPKGAELNYYFEVWDNDQINGLKSTKSSHFQLKKLSEKELEKRVDKNTEQIQSNLSQSLRESKQLQKELEAARKKLLQKSSLDFNDKKMLEDLLKKQEELQAKLENSKDEIKRNFDKKNELTKQDKSILDQQKQLEEMIEQMKSPELKELLDKINELIQKSEKNELMQSIDKLDSKSEKMEKNIDRLMQLYKNLDYKQKMNDMIDKLQELAKEQKKAALESEINKPNSEKQKEITKEVEEANKKMDELSKLNNEVNKTDKKEMDEIKNDLNEANQEQKQAEKELEDKDGKQASEQQNKAARKLNEAARKLNELKNKQKKKQKKEDARMMRRLLENVMYLSFEQEKILEKTKLITINSPSFVKLIQEEQRIKEDFKQVEDSLYKIASRQVKIRKKVFEIVDKINNNTQLAIQRLVDRKPHQAISNEQYTMASYNDLGLIISESLKNLEEDVDDNDSNSDQCENPKPSKKKKPSMSLDKLAEMQEQLNQQMEKLQEKLKGKQIPQGKEKQGSKPGEENPGNSPNGSEAAEFARIAAQQQAIRNALKKMEESSNNPDKSGKKPLGGGLQDAIDKMNQSENDLVNKRLNEEMIRRQKDIQVKLLESAKAMREQDEEQQRESEKAKKIIPDLPLEMKRYLENKKQNGAQIQRKPIGLTPYFKTLSEKYFKLIK